MMGRTVFLQNKNITFQSDFLYNLLKVVFFDMFQAVVEVYPDDDVLRP